MKQTAVEWMVQEINKINVSTEARIFINKLENQAKEMEKEQIIEAHGNKKKLSRGVTNYEYTLTGEEYYKETFKSE